MADRWTDDGSTEKILFSHILTMRGSDILSLLEFRSVVWEEIV